MTAWWEALTTFQQVMFVMASIATIIMAIFLILMIFGIHGGDAYAGDAVDINGDGIPDIHIDTGSDVDDLNHEPLGAMSGLRILSVRTVLAFFAVGGWTAYALADVISPWLASLCGLLAGAIAAFLLAFAMKAMMRLENEGTIDYHNAIGKTASVYIKVPKGQKSFGKVNLTLQERYIEADAVTDGDEDLSTGTTVEVVGVRDEQTLIVRRK
jgi:hypothetical protein